jgi:hypothetical protein
MMRVQELSTSTSSVRAGEEAGASRISASVLDTDEDASEGGG